MEWFGAGFNGPLVAVRGIHFAATAILAGTLLFRTAVLAPALESDAAACSDQTAYGRLRAQSLGVGWIAFVITLVSGAIWLLLQAVSMSGLPFGDAMSSVLLGTVLNETQFGTVSEIRAALAMVLLLCLASDRFLPANWLALTVALALAASIAWTG